MLCSDGLTDLVSDEEILEISKAKGDKQDALTKLVEMANLRGGHDNITTVLLQVAEDKLFEDIEEGE
jgi:protein phosphatase